MLDGRPFASAGPESTLALARLAGHHDEETTVQLLLPHVDAFARRWLDAAHFDRAGRVDAQVLQAARELGLFGLTIGPTYGGAGLGLQGASSVLEVLARHDRAFATTLGLHVGLGARPLSALGSPRLRAAWLPRLASGEVIAAFAATEANAGSDIASVRTRATRESTAGALRLDGQKMFITNGGHAGVFTVLASTPGLGGRRGLSMLLVPRASPGLAIGAEEEKLGLRGSSTTPVSFDGVHVPDDHVLGAPGRGLEQLGNVLAWGRTLMAAGCAGVARAAFERAVAHVKMRSQFGHPLADLDVVRGHVADMAAALFMIVACVRHTARAVDDETGTDADAMTRRSLATKVLASEAAWDVVDVALQLHGAAGYLEPTGMPLLLRDARVMRIFEGANDVLLLRAGALEAAAHRARARLSGRTPPAFAALAARADRLDEDLARTRRALLDDAGATIGARQADLHRLGRFATLCESVDAVVLRASAEGDASSALLAARWADRAEQRARVASDDLHATRSELHAITDAVYGASS